jgi:uncharacterized protein YuzE
MKLTYDPETDALNVELLAGRSTQTIELTPDTFADLDASGRLLSVEILEASAKYGRDVVENALPAAEWLTLAEAAKEGGIATATLRVLLNAKRLKGRKRGRQWEVARAELWNYLDNRAPSGKPATAGARRSRTAAVRR